MLGVRGENMGYGRGRKTPVCGAGSIVFKKKAFNLDG